MLPIGSIFSPLRVAPMRIDTNFKGLSIEKLRQYTNLLKSPTVDAVNVKCFTVVVLTV